MNIFKLGIKIILISSLIANLTPAQASFNMKKCYCGEGEHKALRSYAISEEACQRDCGSDQTGIKWSLE